MAVAVRATLATMASVLILLAGVTPPPANAQVPQSLIAKVNAAVDADTPRLIDIFKDLHQHPEVGFTEVRTSAIVARELKALGFTVTEKIGKTGVVGVMANGPGPTVWFRADMDSNAVREATGLPYAAIAKQRWVMAARSM